MPIDVAVAPPSLSAEQIRYMDIFGYLHLPGLLAADIDEISADFDSIFANEANGRLETFEAVHFGERRVTIPHVVDLGDKLRALRSDPRILGVVGSLLGPDVRWEGSDGNEFFCETSWHIDAYGADMTRTNIKMTFYLEPLTTGAGAICVLPGSHFRDGSFGTQAWAAIRGPERAEELLGVSPRDVPSWSVETHPGDAVVWWYTTMHASFGTTDRRRLFSMNWSAEAEAATAARKATTAA